MEISEKEGAETQNKRTFQLHSFTILILLGIIVVLAAGFGVWQYRSHRYIPGKVTFQEYAPGFLPAGISITDKTIKDSITPSTRPPRYTMLNLGLSDGSFIYEKMNIHKFDYRCPAGKAEHETCAIGQTPHGQRYQLITTSILDVPQPQLYQAIEWLQGEHDTDIHVNLDSANLKGYPTSTIEKMIDSFTPTNYKGLPVQYIDNSRI